MPTVTSKRSIPMNRRVDLRDLLSNLESLYPQWHPQHKRFKFVVRTPELVGSRFVFQEDIEGTSVHVKGVITSCSESSIDWRSDSRIAQVGGSIRIENGSIVQEVHYAFSIFVYIIAKLFRRIVPAEKLSRHIDEELHNMKMLIATN